MAKNDKQSYKVSKLYYGLTIAFLLFLYRSCLKQFVQFLFIIDKKAFEQLEKKLEKLQT